MNKLILFLLLTMSFCCLWAADNAKLVIKMKDGSEQIFMISERPSLSFENGNLVVDNGLARYSYAMSNVQKYFFRDYTTDTETIKDENGHSVVGDFVKVITNKAGTQVMLFSASGALVSSIKTDKSGMAVISMKSLPAGVYVVNYLENSYKITKR